MRVAVIGSGTAGCAAALFHQRRGDEVVLYERVAHPGPVGAGLLLQPTGMAVLRRLGLLDAVLAKGDRVEALRGVTAAGRVVVDLRYTDLEPGLFGLGIQRGALFEELYGAVRAAGIEVWTGVEIDRYVESDTHVEVAGDRYDRLLVCDGARSHLRPPWARVTPYPWGALWYLTAAQVDRATLRQVYRDTREFVGFLPSGQGQTSIFWSIRADAVDRWRASGLEPWKAAVRRLAPDAPLDALVSPDQVVFAPYFDVRMPRWHTARVAWLGDSAHAMSPQLGQGANLALWDAAEVADCTDLADYSRRRRRHVGFYQFASRWLTPFFQSSFPILAPARDLGAPLFHRWAWYRRQMLASLAGIKTGLFTGMDLRQLG